MRLARLLGVLVAVAGLGCTKITVPVSFALVGDANTISLEIPFLNDSTFETSLVGGADATVEINLDPLKLFSPQGIVAAISVQQIRIAGDSIDLFGLSTGTICIYDDTTNPSGGFAYLRPLQNQADFTLTFNTLISPIGAQIQKLFPTPLPFSADIDQTVPVTLVDLLDLLSGKGPGIQLTQEIQSTLPDTIPILGGSIVTADLTLATAQSIPSDPLLTDCENFLAGQ